MSTVLIHNFDRPFWDLGGKFFHYSNCSTLLRQNSNVRVIAEGKKNQSQVISEFLITLLINDKIYMTLDNFLELFQLLGFENVRTLLLENIFGIIYDGSYDPIMIKKDSGFLYFGHVCSLETALSIEEEISDVLESKLNYLFREDSKFYLRKYEINHLQLLVEKNVIRIDSNVTTCFA